MTTPEGRCVACGAAVAETQCGQCGAVTRAGNYRVLSVLGQTPHSRTYVAEDPSGRKVALKELLFATVPTLQQVEGFEREGRLLQELDHPRIPRFVDSFKEGEGRATRLYLAQELVEGESLWARLHGGAFDEPQVRDVMTQVLEVLAYLHGRTPRVIHRDVKPHNLISRPDGSVALVDFGAARELDTRVTHQATLVGTYGYMPPDQLAGTVDPTSDLYALGATAMHLLTGRPPEKLVGEDLELGAGISLNVSPDFDKLIRKMAARSMARRFESAPAALVAMRALPPLKDRGSIKRLTRVQKARLAATAGIVLVVAAAGTVWKLRAPPPAPAEVAISSPVAPPATETVKVWAWEPKVQLFEAANTSSALAGQTFAAGTELLVDRPLDCGLPFVKVLSPRHGYLRTGDLRDAPPRYDNVMQLARTTLGDGEVARAEAEAERAHAVRPQEREPLALLLALFNAQRRVDDAQRANELIRALGDAPSSPSAPATMDLRAGADPKAGETWYIGGTTLRMRQKPSADAKILAELPINTAVEVVGVKGDWAEVKWERQTIVEELRLDGGPQPESEPPAPVRGFVAQAYLVREQVDKAWTLAKADDAVGRKELQEAERHLARASAVDPVDRSLQLRLARAGVEARDYPVAASAAVAAVELASGAGEPLVEIRLAYRCRGDRSRAEWTDDSVDPERMQDDACVESLTPAQCEPCECRGEGDEGESSVVEDWRKEEAERRGRQDMVDRDFPDGAWLRVKVTGPARATPENHIVIYAVRLDSAQDDGQCLSESPQVEAVDAGPVPPAGKDVTIWVNVGQYAGPVYGVAFGKSVQSVSGMVERETPACGPAHLPHSIGISDEDPTCDICVCDD